MLKYFNVKTDVYMVAEAWDQVEKETLIKSWKKLRPGVKQDFIDIYKNIGCKLAIDKKSLVSKCFFHCLDNPDFR